MSADYPPELVPDWTEGQEELWDSSSEEDEGSVPIGTESKRVTRRASPFIQSTFHCFCVVVYVGIKTYESSIFKTIPNDKLHTNFSGWYTFGARWKYLTYINLVSSHSSLPYCNHGIIRNVFIVGPVWLLLPGFLHRCGPLQSPDTSSEETHTSPL